MKNLDTSTPSYLPLVGIALAVAVLAPIACGPQRSVTLPGATIGSSSTVTVDEVCQSFTPFAIVECRTPLKGVETITDKITELCVNRHTNFWTMTMPNGSIIRTDGRLCFYFAIEIPSNGFEVMPKNEKAPKPGHYDQDSVPTVKALPLESL